MMTWYLIASTLDSSTCLQELADQHKESCLNSSFGLSFMSDRVDNNYF